MRRRTFLSATLAAVAAPAFRARAEAAPALIDEARRLARSPYAPPVGKLPPPFAGLDYDAYRAIRPRPGAAAMLPLGPDWAMDLLPPGLYFPDPVRVEIATAEGIREMPFSPDLFSFDPRYFGTIPDTAPGAGFSGLRLRHPLNAPDRLDEVLVMQGASYFRAVGRAMSYGLSARAVALGTGGPEPEEFPRITRIRLHPPGRDSLRLEAVIDSPSLAGHLEMRVHPGAETQTALSVTLIPRQRIADVGVAPLTSMYLKGPLRAAVSDDFRPRVHDSDVLFIENGAGERLWRPVSNPAAVQSSAFLDRAPDSFGLYQTPRDFADFQDAEARYHTRPSAVVRPGGDWGEGAVMLVEIPTGDEFMDNVVAFWRPAAPLEPGTEHRFAYTVDWTLAPPPQRARAPILQTRSGRVHDRPGTLRYVVDFAGDPAGLTPEIWMQGGEARITGMSLFALPGGGAMRATFLLTPGSTPAAELRLVLRDATGRAASPVWLHRWTPARDDGT